MNQKNQNEESELVRSLEHRCQEAYGEPAVRFLRTFLTFLSGVPGRRAVKWQMAIGAVRIMYVVAFAALIIWFLLNIRKSDQAWRAKESQQRETRATMALMVRAYNELVLGGVDMEAIQSDLDILFPYVSENCEPAYKHHLSELVDGWGNVFSIEISEGIAKLVSNGDDGVKGTADDETIFLGTSK